jgi:anhydro-N-acetylmuramic acid kinase
MIKNKYNSESNIDLLRTGVEFSAVTIANSYKDFVLKKFSNLSKIIFTGGGARNKTLINRIRELLPNIKVESLHETDPTLSTYKEAIAFAILANETLSGRAANVPIATGASRATILGQISF